MAPALKPDTRPGTYLLWLHCAVTEEQPIGMLGTLTLQPGYYAYVGSAFGPGGLAARIGRHLRRTTKPHWHIDYLKTVTVIEEIWFAYGPRRLEHAWAGQLGRTPGARIPLPGFGSSDCRCPAHLFHFGELPQPFAEPGLRRLVLNEGRQAACTGMA